MHYKMIFYLMESIYLEIESCLLNFTEAQENWLQELLKTEFGILSSGKKLKPTNQPTKNLQPQTLPYLWQSTWWPEPQ